MICGDASSVCRPACVVQAEDEMAQVGHGGQVWAPGQPQLESHQIGGQLEKPLQPLRRLMLPERHNKLCQEQTMDLPHGSQRNDVLDNDLTRIARDSGTSIYLRLDRCMAGAAVCIL